MLPASAATPDAPNRYTDAMKSAFAGLRSFVSQRRRVFLLGTLTVLLHWLVLMWLVAQMGPRRDVHRGLERVAMVTVLLPEHSAPLHVVAPPPPPPPPRATPKPRRAPKPVVVPPPEVPVAAPEPDFAEALADAMTRQGDGAAVGIPGEQGQPLETTPAVVKEIVQVSAPEPKLPVYKMAPPPSADLLLTVDRIDADGTKWTGEAAIRWRRAADHYKVKVEIGISVLVTRVNLVVLNSEGTLGEAGLMPVKMTEKRRGRSETATHFNAADKKITFSASQASFALQPGAQDKASIPLQLAAIARGDPSQLHGEIAVQVAEDKDASVYRFIVIGQETITTPLGRMQAWHLSRPPVPGSYSSRLDIWLAPEHDWYPVKITNLEANGAVTTQTVSKITLTDTGI
jgi:hypothetical protein